MRRESLPQFSLSLWIFLLKKKLPFFPSNCSIYLSALKRLIVLTWGCRHEQGGELACHFQTGFGVWEPQGNKLIHCSQNCQIMELKVQNSSNVVTSAGGAPRSPPKCSVSASVVPVWLLTFQDLYTREAGEQTFGSNLLTWKCDFIFLARMRGSMVLLERPLLIMRWYVTTSWNDMFNKTFHAHVQPLVGSQQHCKRFVKNID